MSEKANQGPVLISINVTASALDLTRRLWELGALEGVEGNQWITREIQPVIEVLFHILAGGDVELRVKREGSRRTVSELNALLDRALAEANASNRSKPGGCVIPI